MGIHTHIPECTAFAGFWQHVSKSNLFVAHQQRAFPSKYRISSEKIPAKICKFWIDQWRPWSQSPCVVVMSWRVGTAPVYPPPPQHSPMQRAAPLLCPCRIHSPSLFLSLIHLLTTCSHTYSSQPSYPLPSITPASVQGTC